VFEALIARKWNNFACRHHVRYVLIFFLQIKIVLALVVLEDCHSYHRILILKATTSALCIAPNVH
jgi:hypothetical protein